MEEIEKWENCGESKMKNYYVSNFGRVRSIIKKTKIERFLKGTDAGNGYLRVDINKKLIHIHRLVAYAFLGPRPDGLVIDHFDRNKLNNKANNLRYVTYTENNRNTDRYRSDILDKDPIERNKVFCKERYYANRDDRLEKKKEYYEANRDVIIEKNKEYYKDNKEVILEKRKEYYKANREKLNEKIRCPCGKNYTCQHKHRHERSKKHQNWLATQP